MVFGCSTSDSCRSPCCAQKARDFATAPSVRRVPARSGGTIDPRTQTHSYAHRHTHPHVSSRTRARAHTPAVGSAQRRTTSGGIGGYPRGTAAAKAAADRRGTCFVRIGLPYIARAPRGRGAAEGARRDVAQDRLLVLPQVAPQKHLDEPSHARGSDRVRAWGWANGQRYEVGACEAPAEDWMDLNIVTCSRVAMLPATPESPAPLCERERATLHTRNLHPLPFCRCPGSLHSVQYSGQLVCLVLCD